MSTSYTIFKPRFKKTIADAIYNEVVSNTATYYHWFGKENTWTDFLSPFIPSSAGDYPGQPSENFRYELHVRRDILTAKKVKTSDVAYVVKRINWTVNTVYDMYDDSYESTSNGGASTVGFYGATRLEDALYYVLTSDYNVYKCINNNLNSVSTVMPTGTSASVFSTSDGYTWKFMYTIPVSLRNRFLSSTYMPVTTALKSQFFSNGDINKIIIENGGLGYDVDNTVAIVSGDGYQEDNPYLLSSLQIDNAGSNYTTIDLTVSPPFQSYIEWQSELDVAVGSYIKYTNPSTTRDNFYYIISGTKLGVSGPIHTVGTLNNGSAQLKYVGTTALASATLSGGAVATVSLDDGGSGYQGDPAATITTNEPVTSDAVWTASSNMVLNNIIKYNHNYYQVTTEGITGTTGPTHTSGVAMNNTVEFTFVAKDAIITPIQVKTEAQISLIISPGIDKVYTVLIGNGGTKYAEIPLVTIDAPVSGVQATAVASVSGGKVSIITMTEKGSGYITPPPVTIAAPKFTFNAGTAVTDASHTIEYNTHRLVTGDAVVYNNGGGTSVVNLTSGNTYYIVKIDTNTIQLASSLVNAQNGTILNITTGSGASHTLTLTNGRATATSVLGTGGEIVGYTIDNPGVGYTNAAITINDSTKSVEWNADTKNYNTGKLIVDVGVGNVTTLQANVELLAVPGTIEAIKVVDGGSGYGAATVTILGDGLGATATAECSGGRVVKVNMTNVGSGYTWTDIQFNGNTGSGGASARAIMSPLGGHGSNAIDELNANSIIFYTSISRDKNQGIEINNDYRKVGLVRNLKKYGKNVKFTDDIGSGCVLITGQFDKTLLQYDMLILKDDYKKYRVVDFNDTQILLSVFNNFSVSIGDLLVTDPTDAGNMTATVPPMNIIVTSVSERTIDQFSGDFLMFSVREPYSPTAEQIITARTVLTL